MKKGWFFGVVAAFVASAACGGVGDPTPGSGSARVGGANDPNDGGMVDTGGGGPTTCGPGVAVCSDAQILAISIISDSGEVMVAKSVRDRVVTKSARDLADRMITDHTKMMNDTIDLGKKLGITPVYGGMTMELSDEAKDTVASLAKKSGEELDKDYVNHEVLDHLGDLGMIDHILTPSAKMDEVRSAIADDRMVISTHLQLSLDAQTALEGTCGGADGPPPDDGSE